MRTGNKKRAKKPFQVFHCRIVPKNAPLKQHYHLFLALLAKANENICVNKN